MQRAKVGAFHSFLLLPVAHLQGVGEGDMEAPVVRPGFEILTRNRNEPEASYQCGPWGSVAETTPRSPGPRSHFVNFCQCLSPCWQGS